MLIAAIIVSHGEVLQEQKLKGTLGKDAIWPEHRKCKHFHMQTLQGGSVNIVQQNSFFTFNFEFFRA